MNMRLYKDGKVDYNGTFFALVRTGLSIYIDGGRYIQLQIHKSISFHDSPVLLKWQMHVVIFLRLKTF